MKSLKNKYIENLKYNSEIIKTVAALGEYKGKEELFINQSPETIEKMLESALIESTEASNKIEGITAPHQRIENIVKSNAEPRNRSEQEIAGYRDVLNLIHQSYKDIPLNENVILQFHSMLYRYTTERAGIWKTMDNEIVDKLPDGTKKIRFKTVSAFDTSRYMNEVINSFDNLIDKGNIDSLILIPLFIFDFLCIHPFKDGNGRVGRLLTLLLLYKSGYRVGKFISLERIIDQSKDSYYESLLASSKAWHEGHHDIFPWLNYFHGMMIAAYKEFESRIGFYHKQKTKTDQIKSQIDKYIMPFSISDLEKACPNITRDMIRKVLRDLRDAGEIKSTGVGRNAKWVKINRVTRK